MKKWIAAGMTCLMLLLFSIPVFADNDSNNGAENEIKEYELQKPAFDFSCRSAVLMEAETGTVLYAENQDAAYSPASVTKIMTLLLVMEAVDDGKIAMTDEVSVSGYAASMGGSQVFLQEGELFTVEELVKCAVIASANDASVALAETVGGSESAFVGMMNQRAGELGMKTAHFENVTGLDDTTENHVCSAMDIAIMSRELLRHKQILKYTTLWQDSIRDGAFTLTNTNRLVRFYNGCNGLKTGSTDKAGYCISACAQRDGMQLIAVVMGADTKEERNSIARSMLDFGFANYTLYTCPEQMMEQVPVTRADMEQIPVFRENFCVVINKSDRNRVECFYDIPERLTAPLKAGQTVGKIRFCVGGAEIGHTDLTVRMDVPPITFWGMFANFFKLLFGVEKT